jgi:hypothetical protein
MAESKVRSVLRLCSYVEGGEPSELNSSCEGAVAFVDCKGLGFCDEHWKPDLSQVETDEEAEAGHAEWKAEQDRQKRRRDAYDLVCAELRDAGQHRIADVISQLKLHTDELDAGPDGVQS